MVIRSVNWATNGFALEILIPVETTLIAKITSTAVIDEPVTPFSIRVYTGTLYWTCCAGTQSLCDFHVVELLLKFCNEDVAVVSVVNGGLNKVFAVVVGAEVV